MLALGGYSKENKMLLARERLLGTEIWLRDTQKGREALKGSK